MKQFLKRFPEILIAVLITAFLVLSASFTFLDILLLITGRSPIMLREFGTYRAGIIYLNGIAVYLYFIFTSIKDKKLKKK